MKNIVLGVFLATTFLFWGTNEANAQCSCSNAGESAIDELKRSQAVFVGEVVRIKKIPAVKNSDYVDFDVTFKIKTAWKTDLNETLTVRNIEANSSDFKEGESYLVYAFVNENTLSAYIGCCTRTIHISTSAADLEAFRKKGEKPTQIVKTKTPIL